MVKILFVCLGNICRSPAAEGAMKTLIEERGLEGKITCDSAGTSAYHEGDPADGRMRDAALERGIDLTSISRQFLPKDFIEFDYILTMDQNNYNDLLSIDFKRNYQHKILPFVQFCNVHDIDKVPDPYYGGADGFNLVMDIVEDGCKGFLDYLSEKKRCLLEI